MLRVAALLVVVGLAHGLQDLVDLAASLNATQLVKLIAKAGFTNTLKGQGPFTLLAPSDAAFSAVPTADMAKIIGDKNSLANLIKYHVMSGEMWSGNVTTYGRIVYSLSGHAIRVYKKGNDMYINNARVIKMDVEGVNGVMYLIDTVLDVPEGTIYQVLEKSEYTLSTFKRAVENIGEAQNLNTTFPWGVNFRYTVFAPTDAAFARLGKAQMDHLLQFETYASELVRYHIHDGALRLKNLNRNGTVTTQLPGDKIAVDAINGDIRLNRVARMIQSDIEADNGVVHVIDHVLIPRGLSSLIVVG